MYSPCGVWYKQLSVALSLQKYGAHLHHTGNSTAGHPSTEQQTNPTDATPTHSQSVRDYPTNNHNQSLLEQQLAQHQGTLHVLSHCILSR